MGRKGGGKETEKKRRDCSCEIGGGGGEVARGKAGVSLIA